jgi:hypothetical protein
VLYIDAELMPNEIEKFFHLELNGLGFQSRKFDLILAKSKTNSTGDIDLLDKDMQKKLDDEFNKYDLIIIDPYYKLVKDNEIQPI